MVVAISNTKIITPCRKGLINIQNFDYNKSFKWFWVWYLHPADDNPRRIIKAEKLFWDELHFEDIKFTVKIKYSQICKKEFYQH